MAVYDIYSETGGDSKTVTPKIKFYYKIKYTDSSIESYDQTVVLDTDYSNLNAAMPEFLELVFKAKKEGSTISNVILYY